MGFLFASERFHGRLDRHSATSDVPTIAPRLDCAGADYKVVRRRGRDLSYPQYGKVPTVSLRAVKPVSFQTVPLPENEPHRMTVAHIAAPDKPKTSPEKIIASKVDSVHGVRMWITPLITIPAVKYSRLFNRL